MTRGPDQTSEPELPEMKLDHLVTKSCAAFLFSFQTLWNRPGGKYFWTFTPDGYLSDREFYEAWKRFLRRWNACGCVKEWAALRIFEPFQSGFLHCHLICDHRFGVTEMRELVRGTGIGRIHVRRAVKADAQYLSKYMSKTQKFRELERGRRAWAKVGNWQHTRVKDVEVESTLTKATALVRLQYPHLRWSERGPLIQEVYLRMLSSNHEKTERAT